jgi:hypothetical protein
MRPCIRLIPGALALLLPLSVLSATPVIEIEIRDHLFLPSEIVIPADTKIKLLIKNLDPTPEEFESYELNREKVISGKSNTVIFIGPLPPGEYPFFGEFHPKTAQGRILVQ